MLGLIGSALAGAAEGAGAAGVRVGASMQQYEQQKSLEALRREAEFEKARMLEELRVTGARDLATHQAGLADQAKVRERERIGGIIGGARTRVMEAGPPKPGAINNAATEDLTTAGYLPEAAALKGIGKRDVTLVGPEALAIDTETGETIARGEADPAKSRLYRAQADYWEYGKREAGDDKRNKQIGDYWRNNFRRSDPYEPTDAKGKAKSDTLGFNAGQQLLAELARTHRGASEMTLTGEVNKVLDEANRVVAEKVREQWAEIAPGGKLSDERATAARRAYGFGEGEEITEQTLGRKVREQLMTSQGGSWPPAMRAAMERLRGKPAGGEGGSEGAAEPPKAAAPAAAAPAKGGLVAGNSDRIQSTSLSPEEREAKIASNREQARGIEQAIAQVRAQQAQLGKDMATATPEQRVEMSKQLAKMGTQIQVLEKNLAAVGGRL